MTSMIKPTSTRAELKVLLVEDNLDDAEMIQELLLTNRGSQALLLTPVVRLSQALEYLRQETFDAILLDLSLPDSQGFQTVARLQEYGLNIPIIVLTGNINEEIATQSIQAGVQEYLVKREVDSKLLMRSLRYAIARQKRQAAWRQSEEKYRFLVDNIKEVIFQVDVAGNWIFLNAAWTEITGFGIPETLGTPFLNYIHPDDRQRNIEYLRPLIEGQKEDCRYKTRYLTKTNNFRWIEVQARLTFAPNGTISGTAGTLNDINDQILAQEQLQTSQEFLKHTLNAIADPIFVKDEEHHLIVFNNAFCQLIGKSREEIICQSDYDLFSKEQADISWEKDTQAFSTGGENENEETLIGNDGKERVLSTKKKVFKSTDGNKFLVGTIRDVTSYKEQQTKLEESQRFIQKIATSIPNILYLYDIQQKRNVYTNCSLAEVLGYTAAEIQEMGTDILPTLTHPDDFNLLLEYWQQIEIGLDGEIFEIEYRMRHRDGSWRWLISRDTAFARDSENQITQILGTATDITERKQVEEEIHLLLTATQAISQSQDVQSALADILRLLCREIGWHFGEAWIPNPGNKVLEYSQIWYADNKNLDEFGCQSQKVTFAPEIGLPGRIWSSKQPEWIEDVSDTQQPVFLRTQIAAQMGLKSCFGVPILTGEQVLAVLVFFKITKSPKESRLVDLVNAIATQLGIHIHRKQTESALRESEERFRSLVANLPGAIYRCCCDEHCTMEFISDEIEVISGYRAADLIQNQRLTFASIIHPEDAGTVKREVATAIAAKHSYNLEYRIIHANGSVRWIAEKGRAEKSQNGDVLWLDGLIFDITRSKQSELSLLQVRAAVESTSDAIAIADLDGNSIYHNQAFIHRYGYTAEELNEAGGPALIHAKSNVLREIFKSLRKGCSWSGEVELKTKWGKIVQTQLRADCIVDKAGQKVGMIALIADITELKQKELALRISEQRLQLAIEGSALGLWDWNISTGETYFDPQWKRMLGYEIEEIENHYKTWERLTHPEDLPKALTALKDYMEGRISAYEVEFRMLTKDGNWKWILAGGKVVERDQWGTPLRMSGTNKDISDRKATEEDIFKLAQELQQAQKIAHIGNWEFDLATETISWSDEVFRIYGREIGKTPTFIELLEQIHVEDRTEFQQLVEKAISEGQAYDLDHRIYRLDGEIRHINSKGKAFKNESGQVVRLFGTTMDITERKQAEITLQQQLKRERLLGTILDRIRSSLNLEEILKTAVAEVRQFLQTERTVIYQFSSDWSGVVVVESVADGAMAILGMDIQDNCFMEKYVPLYLQGLVNVNCDIHNSDRHPCYVELLEQLQVKANLVAPILEGENLWGLLIAHNCSGPRNWQEYEIECLKQISWQLAIAIQQSILFEKAQTEISERKQALTALRDSEARERSKAVQLEVAMQKLKSTQTQLIHNEKMVSLGQLVAGVAHEINNPVNFIYGNLSPAKDYCFDLLQLVQIYQAQYPQPTTEILDKIRDIDLDYICNDLPNLFNSMKVGAERIREIVKSLRTFSRLDEAEMKFVNIHEGIESTLLILQSRLNFQGSTSQIMVVKNYGKLPKVECCAGQLNQVFMNVLGNAIDALEEWVKKREINCDRTPTINIRTYLVDSDRVAISITDNGPGIPEKVRQKLFDPFFTTKPVGKGTGLGLSISHSIVVERHRGKITCISTPEQGAEFIIEIPLKQK
ncbi:histidine kinase [Oscillatoriales cyanobacterium USR001]|nr:histidine kinase [Oscillatoriales cyanobacterium USR001]